MTHAQKFISRPQLCKVLGVSKATIKRWTKTRGFPKPLLSSGRVPLYEFSTIEEWVSDQERNEGAQPQADYSEVPHG